MRDDAAWPDHDQPTEDIFAFNGNLTCSDSGKGRDPASLPEGTKRYFSVYGPSTTWIGSLVEADERYAHYLRIVLLRTALWSMEGAGSGVPRSVVIHLLESIGFESPHLFLKQNHAADSIGALRTILGVWERDLGCRTAFPPTLERNLQRVSEMVGLNSVETELLGLAVLIHAEHMLRRKLESLGDSFKAFIVPQLLTAISGLQRHAVEQALQQQGRMSRSDLLTLDYAICAEIPLLMDLIAIGFAGRMISERDGEILRGFITRAPMGRLEIGDYGHLGRVPVMLQVLRQAIDGRSKGVNVLLHGMPGTGKTELARLMARELGVTGLEIAADSMTGEAVTPVRRLRCHRLAMEMSRRCAVGGVGDALVIFDECEEVMADDSMVVDGDRVGAARKSYLNATLEDNPTPCIWIANAVSGFDASYLRRFTMVLEIKANSASVRETFKPQLAIEDSALSRITRHPMVAPALLKQTAQILEVVGKDLSCHQRSELAVELVNDHLGAAGHSLITVDGSRLAFRPEWVNCKVDLLTLRDSLARTRQGRLLFTGPPGLGKTSIGRWLSESIGATHICLKASDLLSKYVGETERAIAEVFRRARSECALLQIDEIDSFLQSRQGAQHQWEVTLVTEFLQQLDGFEGLFLGSTNLHDQLDPAAVRRFEMNIAVDFLKGPAAVEMFRELCSLLDIEPAGIEQDRAIGSQTLLAPSDFDQIVRQHRLVPVANADDVLQRLMETIRLKRNKFNRGSMGFIRAAA